MSTQHCTYTYTTARMKLATSSLMFLLYFPVYRVLQASTAARPKELSLVVQSRPKVSCGLLTMVGRRQASNPV